MDGDHANYECVNGQNAGRDYRGHSTHWHKCPTYLDIQQKLKKSIPYYHQKNLK